MVEGRRWTPRVVSIVNTPGRVEVAYSFAEEAIERFGAPRQLSITAIAVADHVELTLRWSGKSASRVPEALWLGFAPTQATLSRSRACGEAQSITSCCVSGRSSTSMLTASSCEM